MTVIDTDPCNDRKELENLADWCTQFAPGTAIDFPEGLWLDVTGVAQLWGGEQALAQHVVERLAARGIPGRVAIADSFGAAWALRRYGDSQASVLVVPPEEHRLLLPALPLRALRLTQEILSEVEQLGLRRIGQILALPRDQLARRFGEGFLLRLDQAIGDATETIAFRQMPTPWFVRRRFAEPIAHADDLTRGLELLAENLCHLLSKADRGGLCYVACFHRADNTRTSIKIDLSVPTRDGQRIAQLLSQKLDQIDPGFGIEIMSMTAQKVEPLAPLQFSLPSKTADKGTTPARPSANGNRAGHTVPRIDTIFLDKLGNRLGFGRLWRMAPRQSHLPERAAIRLSPVATAVDHDWVSGSPRPIRLLHRPEPIEAVIAPVPDEPPVQFRWRKMVHRVGHAEGPERIAYEWWRQSAPVDREEIDLIRDYYRVEDLEGRRFWIYRAGLFNQQQISRWYLHGFFA